MADFKVPIESEVVGELPDDIASVVGNVIVAYAILEHQLSRLSSLLLQLSNSEARIALRMPRAEDRLEMALDLFAIKGIPVKTEENKLRAAVRAANTYRDQLAHGLWLKHPETGQLHLRIARGNWPKDLSGRQKISRAIFPQSIPHGIEQCKAALEAVQDALALVDQLGHEINSAILNAPEKFREPLPVPNPLGVRSAAEQVDPN